MSGSLDTAASIQAPAGARVITIVMNGVTGRMGMRQHLIRSILAIRRDGGLRLGERTLWPEPILVGRNERKLRAIAGEHGLERWTTDLDAALAAPDAEIYFDAGLTGRRPETVRRAIAAGKHVYCEKPLAGDLEAALDLARAARDAGIKHGVVQDKLYLPGLRKLARTIDAGRLGRLLSLRGEFGYWIFEGNDGAGLQRPSWNYRAEDGGGIVADMFPHWQYVLERLVGSIEAVSCETATHVRERVDESGRPYAVSAQDAAYATFDLAGGVIAQLNSSWCVRVYRDELVEFQLDGIDGSAVAGLHECRYQSRSETPRLSWDPDVPLDQRPRAQWSEVPAKPGDDKNAFRAQWEEFLAHVVDDRPIGFDFFDGARGVQVAHAGLRSSREGRRIELPLLDR